MTIWQALAAELAPYHPHARVFPHGVRFVLEFGGTRVGCSMRAFDDASYVVYVELGAATAMDPMELLRLNAGLGDEALAMIDGVFYVRSVIPRALPVAELEQRIQSAARIAAAVKSEIKRPYDTNVFAHYAH